MKHAFRRRLQAGERLLGTLVSLASPEIAEILAGAGFDWLFLDAEHAPLNAPRLQRILQGAGPAVPCLVRLPGRDEVFVKKALDIGAAHIVGASMGGMIAQMIAIEHPDRVLSLTSIMSTTGASDMGQPDPEAMMALLTPPPTDREGAIASTVETSRIIGGSLFDEADARARAAEAYDRCFHPAGAAFQIAAIAATGDRTERLRQVQVPTLVIHGREDSLVTLSGGEATAAAVPGADLLVLGQMGHDIPRVYWPQVADAIFGIAVRGEDR